MLSLFAAAVVAQSVATITVVRATGVYVDTERGIATSLVPADCDVCAPPQVLLDGEWFALVPGTSDIRALEMLALERHGKHKRAQMLARRWRHR